MSAGNKLPQIAAVQPISNKSAQDTIRIIIETPKGSQNKYKFDEELKLFKLAGVLPVGATFPFDFGFVPMTLAEDGDPLDVLLLADSPAFPGCVVEARVLGVLQAEQTEDGETTRNDRLIAVTANSRTYQEFKSIHDLSEGLRRQIEHFFVSYNREKGKEFKVIGEQNVKAAIKLVNQSIRQKKRAA